MVWQVQPAAARCTLGSFVAYEEVDLVCTPPRLHGEKNTPFSVISMRSQALYQAAQDRSHGLAVF